MLNCNFLKAIYIYKRLSVPLTDSYECTLTTRGPNAGAAEQW